MCAKHFLHCSIKKVNCPRFYFFLDFVFLISLVLPWLYHIFLKSSLLFEIILVEVRKNILSTFVSFQLVSRQISLAKEKTSLSTSLSSKYRRVHMQNFF